MRHGAIRTVRKGAVVIGGVRFRPQSDYLPYDGRLDGRRYVFGRYEKPGRPGEFEPFVSLWGTEAQFRSQDDLGDGPHVVDGTLPWDWWRAE